MKIGILTMYYRRNYGGILQSYAMMKVLQGLGHQVEVIDFRYESHQTQNLLTRIISKLKRILKAEAKKKTTVLVRQLPQEHIEAFNKFKAQYMTYSDVATNDTIGLIAPRYDAVVVGSDQVWNNVSDATLFYFIGWTPEYDGLRIAYAPCSIYPDVPQYNRQRLGALLNKFNAVAVRDETTADMVQSVTGIRPQVVLDPSCLYDYSEFVQDALIEGDYIFAYILGSEIACGHHEVIRRIKEKYGNMKVVAAIIPNVSLEVEKFADDIRYNASPSEWVNFVAHSKFVYTDSFHGCMFAMKYHKQYLAYYKDSRRVSRLMDIKVTYDIDNIIPSGSDIILHEIDYEKVDRLFSEKRKESMLFIRQSLEIR